MKKKTRKKTKAKAKREGTLTGKRLRFVEVFVVEAKSNGAEAARLAGYRARTNHGYAVVANKLLTNGDIQAGIAARRKALEAAGMANDVEVVTFLTSTMRGTECRKPIVTIAGVLRDAEGEIVTEPPDGKVRLGAAAELVKVLGLAAPKKLDVTSNGAAVGVNIYIPDNGRDQTP